MFKSDRCFNPLKFTHHKKNSLKELRKPSVSMLQLLKINEEDSKYLRLCDSCRKALSRKETLVIQPLQCKIEDQSIQRTSSSSDSENDTVEPSGSCLNSERSDLNIRNIIIDAALPQLNNALISFGESPVKKKRVTQQAYSINKLDKIDRCMRDMLFNVSSTSNKEDNDDDSANQILTNLKKAYTNATDRNTQIQVLTVLPTCWSIKKVQEEFNATIHMVRTAKQLAKEGGLWLQPQQKKGHILPEKTIQCITEFYESDEFSRVMAGKKDYVTVRQGEEKRQVQKRLILCNLKELYRTFKDRYYPDMKVGFSKFAQLRPAHCVLAGPAGTHSVCVCKVHQNIKLMIDGGKIAQITVEQEYPIRSHNDCVARIICNPALPSCYLEKCDMCPGTSTLENQLITAFDESIVDIVTYKQCLSVDRVCLETLTKPVRDFIDTFIEKLIALKKHSFIASQQNKFFNDTKENLELGEFLIICDFAENYAFIVQDAIQGFHWNNNQVTIHPFVIYYKIDEEIKIRSFVVISEHIKHSTVDVYLFQKCLIEYLKANFDTIKKIYYFSDGAAAQYKNRKNFINLCHHREDFEIKAEWHFFATSHGKGPCDGIAGTIKRLASKTSLQRPIKDQILTPVNLYQWANNYFTSMAFTYTTIKDHEKEERELKERFDRARTVRGTLSTHACIPFSRRELLIKQYSYDTKARSITICNK